ncbi:L-cystine-binding protein FliY [bioreactor metagenome]|jgi:polar amino acid transport system substrate-binding protein|uniref:Transporter substrate-binding domain-containing protein n=2 Tax=root TaxID=1 RepID=A0AAN0MHS4_9ACTN|nr:ABC transporter substrate-binding protein [Brooklawnia sp. SH051]MCB0884157.1 amino acid ABC transporter substrate-binding protein [Propionibacteriaceae bacterium]MEA5120972.1 ABC transporter substrate-binding protein [Propionibacterium sp.]NLI84307.1 amino acid ABC transporter substrate-binding protein [Propionibacterium sp.]BEH03088.1 transporter substrate-binding domain-containing protein [Brooklawnia sp. SH051]
MKLLRSCRIATAVALTALLTALSACTITTETPTSADSASVAGESALLTQIKSRGKIIIGSSNDAPFSYIDANTGELSGLDIAILTEINKRLGIPETEMKVIDFSNLLVELNNGNIDMVVDAMYVRDERLQVAAFSDKWYQEGEALVVPKDSPIQSKADLVGKSVGAQPGTAFFETAQAWHDAGQIGDLVSYDNQSNLMTAVNLHKVDAVVTDGIVAGYTLAQDSSLNLRLVTPYTPEAAGQIGSAVRFGDEDFLAEVNAALNDMKEDGTLLKILTDFGLSEDYFVGVEDGKTQNVK